MINDSILHLPSKSHHYTADVVCLIIDTISYSRIFICSFASSPSLSDHAKQTFSSGAWCLKNTAPNESIDASALLRFNFFKSNCRSAANGMETSEVTWRAFSISGVSGRERNEISFYDFRSKVTFLEFIEFIKQQISLKWQPAKSKRISWNSSSIVGLRSSSDC